MEEATKHPVLEHYREMLKGGPPPATDFPQVEYGILSTNCRDAEEIVTIYGALSTYLTILAQHPEKDLETIARVTRLMIAIKPQAVEASQEIANRNTAS